MEAMTPISLIMVEDDVDLCQTVKDFLQPEKSLQLLGMAHEEMGFRALIARHLPDLALIDINLTTPRSGLVLLDWIRREYPVVKPVMFTVNEGDVRECYQLGARGFVLKSRLEILPAALIDVAGGKLIIPPDVGELFVQQVLAHNAMMKKSLEFQQFSDREQEILRYLQAGVSREKIGDALKISFFTVRRHIQNILEKSGQTSVRAVLEKFGEVLGPGNPDSG